MGRLRLSITKGEPLRFLGHLDFLRTMERALRRSGLPVAYSEGFNPHMKVNYDSALGVGVTADPLYMDVELAEDLAPAAIAAHLAPQLPAGIELRAMRYIAPKAAKLMAFINYEEYELMGPLTGAYSEAELAAALAAFNARPEIPFRKVTPKKTRDIDVRPIVPEPVKGYIEDGLAHLEFGIYRTLAGSIKPGELWQILIADHGLPAAADTFICGRRGVYQRDEAGHLTTPLEEGALP